MVVDEVVVLRQALSAHRAILSGALQGNAELDIDRAFQVHAALAKILTHWDEFTAHEQREVISTIEYVLNSDDEVNDLTAPDGFADDLERVRRLQALLGYA